MFRYENVWQTHEDYETVVHNLWKPRDEGNKLARVANTLHNIQSGLLLTCHGALKPLVTSKGSWLNSGSNWKDSGKILCLQDLPGRSFLFWARLTISCTKKRFGSSKGLESSGLKRVTRTLPFSKIEQRKGKRRIELC